MNVAGILATKGSDVAMVPSAARVTEALALLRRWGVGALVVVEGDDEMVGLVSERDIVRQLADDGVSVLERPVAEMMTRDILTCQSADPVEALMSVMTEFRVRHLPVVDDEGTICGIVSIGDIVKSRVEELEREQAQLIDYVRSGR